MDQQYIFGLKTRLAKTIENVLEIPFVLGLSLHLPISFLALLLQSSLSTTMTPGFPSFNSTKAKIVLLYLTEGKTKYICVISTCLVSKISANAPKL